MAIRRRVQRKTSTTNKKVKFVTAAKLTKIRKHIRGLLTQLKGIK